MVSPRLSSPNSSLFGTVNGQSWGSESVLRSEFEITLSLHKQTNRISANRAVIHRLLGIDDRVELFLSNVFRYISSAMLSQHLHERAKVTA